MDYYLGQIGIYGFNFAPRGWALCTGQILPIAQNTALYSLLGTTYGGNGQSTFGLPDLRSRTPIGFSNITSMGEMAGVENVTLLVTEMPSHTHSFNTTDANGTVLGASGNIFAAGVQGTTAHPAYLSGTPPNVVLNPGSVSMVGGSQPHNNIQPCLAVNFCIATTGYYPSRN